jgi:hypothetical protein
LCFPAGDYVSGLVERVRAGADFFFLKVFSGKHIFFKPVQLPGSHEKSGNPGNRAEVAELVDAV